MPNTLPAPRPFFSYGKVFRGLSAPALTDLTGDFRAELLGPAWFQAFSRWSVGLGGLPNWYGKRFDNAGNGTNLLGNGTAFSTALPMQVRIEPSHLDGKPVAAVHYGPSSRFPWPLVIDELRTFEHGSLLGMTLVDLPLLHGFALPFLLHRT